MSAFETPWVSSRQEITYPAKKGRGQLLQSVPENTVRGESIRGGPCREVGCDATTPSVANTPRVDTLGSGGEIQMRIQIDADLDAYESQMHKMPIPMPMPNAKTQEPQKKHTNGYISMKGEG